MLKSVVYQGNTLLGEVEIHTLNHHQHSSFNNLFMSKEIRISHFSTSSERCSPLSVLHTISPLGLSFKLESTTSMSQLPDSPLTTLHSTCLRENKTAIMQLGEEELHLVAMSSRKHSELYSYFWCFVVGVGLYDSCLIMLNLRCLGIVFDLDETLVVANTMRSFEDRIDTLQRKISTEMDPQRIDGMLAEIKRYHDDKTILKQYLENDQILDDGVVYKIQSEVVPALSDNHPSIVRPLIRLPEKNIILTRINPAIRDTSVLVRLRPAWEDLRNYLTARGRKRFEVYVCTMAEKDYALEMWRLLDPGLNLINSKELLNRIVCVKAGSRKSLLNVFHASICHPKMALVIDDRLKVWEEKDQPRVHVVPPFVPYFAPQAEVNNTIPVLCVARNVACNVRGGFYKEFDEGLLQRLSDVFYEDDVPDIPSPDVSNYLISEDDASGSNKDPLRSEGISNAEVERRLKETNPAQEVISKLDATPAPFCNAVTTSSNIISQPPSQGSSMLFQDKQLSQLGSSVKLLPNLVTSQSSLQGSPGREEGELPESDIDPDIRRRLLILQHGQDKRDQMTKDITYPVRPPVQASQPPVQSHRSWSPLAEEMSTRQPNQAIPKNLPRDFPSESEAKHFDKHQLSQTSNFYGDEGSVATDRARFEYRKSSKEARRGEDQFRLKRSLSSIRSFSAEASTLGPLVNSKKDFHIERGQDSPLCAETSLEVLQDIANKCRTKVEFRPALINSTELQFSVEVWFAGERVGEGNGRTRKEAQHQATECSIKTLANKYLSTVSPDPTSGCEKLTNLKNESDASGDSTSFGRGPLLKEDRITMSSTSESSRFLDLKLEGSKKSEDSVFVLKHLCFKEGLALMIKGQPTLSLNSEQKEEEQAQVEIEGNVLGTGTGSTWEEAKLQAAEEALGNLNAMIGTRKRQSSPKSSQELPSKRLNTDSSRVLQRLPSYARYS